MRNKDENKLAAICNAAIELITVQGLANASMSKIAKAAKVSPSTIYVYFESKEDMLNKLYIWIKHESSVAFLKGFHEDLPVKEGVRLLWNNIYNSIIAEPVKFAFGEQFANSPLVNKISKAEGGKYYQPIFNLLNRGVSEKIIKNVPIEVLSAHVLAPIMLLAKRQLSNEIVMTGDMLNNAFLLTWASIAVSVK